MTVFGAIAMILMSIVIMGLGCCLLLGGVALFHHVMTWRP